MMALIKALLPAVLLLLLLSVVPPAVPVAVLDKEGNEVRAGQLYRIQQAGITVLGGITMESNGTSSCPLDVVQSTSGIERGLPVMFFPEDVSGVEPSTVEEGALVYVIFPVPTPCPLSTVWQVDKIVTTGGTTNPSGKIGPHFSRFSIRKGKTSGYQLYSCPCKICRMGCSDIGVVRRDGRRLLGVGSGGRPFRVVFVKAESAVPLPVDAHPAA